MAASTNTSMKGIMNPEAARLLTFYYMLMVSPALQNIHHYTPPHTVLQLPGCSTTHHAAAGYCGVSEGSMSSFKSIT